MLVLAFPDVMAIVTSRPLTSEGIRPVLLAAGLVVATVSGGALGASLHLLDDLHQAAGRRDVPESRGMR
jgi:hypothetical protein